MDGPQPVAEDEEFAAFEKHTRGIGTKLLKQMGYKQGMGLGKYNQGTVNPIQPRQFLKRSGIGREECLGM